MGYQIRAATKECATTLTTVLAWPLSSSRETCSNVRRNAGPGVLNWGMYGTRVCNHARDYVHASIPGTECTVSLVWFSKSLNTTRAFARWISVIGYRVRGRKLKHFYGLYNVPVPITIAIDYNSLVGTDYNRHSGRLRNTLASACAFNSERQPAIVHYAAFESVTTSTRDTRDTVSLRSAVYLLYLLYLL